MMVLSMKASMKLPLWLLGAFFLNRHSFFRFSSNYYVFWSLFGSFWGFFGLLGISWVKSRFAGDFFVFAADIPGEEDVTNLMDPMHFYNLFVSKHHKMISNFWWWMGIFFQRFGKFTYIQYVHSHSQSKLHKVQDTLISWDIGLKQSW